MSKIFTKENLKKFFFSFAWMIVLFIAIDQITKWSFHNYFFDKFGEEIYSVYGIRDIPDMIEIIPGFLYIGFALNLGGAFSLGTSDKYDGVNPILLVISIVFSAILIAYYIKTMKKNKKIINASISLMIAGAVGNMIDRAFYRKSITGFKGVIDWIQAYPFGKAFATFNIADSCLVVGVAILIVVLIVDEIKEAINKGKKGEYKYSPNERKEQEKNAKNSRK